MSLLDLISRSSLQNDENDIRRQQVQVDAARTRDLDPSTLMYALQMSQGNPTAGIPANPDLAQAIIRGDRAGIAATMTPKPAAPPLVSPEEAAAAQQRPVAPQTDVDALNLRPGMEYERRPVGRQMNIFNPVGLGANLTELARTGNIGGDYEGVYDKGSGKLVDYVLKGTNQRAPWYFSPDSSEVGGVEGLHGDFVRPLEALYRNVRSIFGTKPQPVSSTFIAQ